MKKPHQRRLLLHNVVKLVAFFAAKARRRPSQWQGHLLFYFQATQRNACMISPRTPRFMILLQVQCRGGGAGRCRASTMRIALKQRALSLDVFVPIVARTWHSPPWPARVTRGMSRDMRRSGGTRWKRCIRPLQFHVPHSTPHIRVLCNTATRFACAN
jgi:hypothetical protein